MGVLPVHGKVLARKEVSLDIFAGLSMVGRVEEDPKSGHTFFDELPNKGIQTLFSFITLHNYWSKSAAMICSGKMPMTGAI